jgi:uncharacterized protein (DUF488 family)
MKDYYAQSNCTTIHTVGYEKTDIDQYVARLLSAKVEMLIDVRERPISRKKGFSKNVLASAVEAAGIQYMHVQELGDPKPGRDAARAGQHELFVKIFSTHMKTAGARGALHALARSVEGKNVCLTCFERDHESCHRQIVADQLADLTGGTVRHLKV